MKEKLEGKINEIVEYIITKPENEITLDDYTILTNELHDIRAREGQDENKKRLAELMATTLSNTGGF